MAGVYPDAPSWRMPIDRDGSVLLTVSTGNVITQVPGSWLTKLNDELTRGNTAGNDFKSQVSGGGYPSMWGVVFPEKRDIDAFFSKQWCTFGSATFQAQVSTDTTNLLDGTWVNLGSSFGNQFGTVSPNYRYPTVGTALAVRGFRFTLAGSPNLEYIVDALHLYGEIAPGENPHRLDIWHPTLDVRVGPAWFDWGDVPRSSSADKAFRVKNLSPSQTANSVRVAMDMLADTTPSVVGQHLLTKDAVTYASQVNVGNLAPGAISQVCTLRRSTLANAVFGPWALRAFAEANSWS